MIYNKVFTKTRYTIDPFRKNYLNNDTCFKKNSKGNITQAHHRAIAFPGRFVFVVITNEIVIEKEGAIDDFVFKKLSAITSPPLTLLMRIITFFGSWYFLLPAYLLLIGWLFASRKKTALWLDITAIGITSTFVLFSVKAIFQRQRPLDPILKQVPGFSFPSGHSFSSFVFMGLLTYIISESTISRRLKWTYGILLFLFAWMIALSRVYLRVHYASDVVAGFFLSIVWLSISYRVLHIVRRKRRVSGNIS